MAERTPPLRPLTAFRFLAALAVFLFHCLLFVSTSRPNQDPTYWRYFCEGYAGVTFFFVLSGFILTYNYHGAFARLRPRQLWTFYTARLARIYPVHLLTFFVAIPLVFSFLARRPAKMFLTGLSHPIALFQLTLTHAFVPNLEYYLSYNAVSWSLSDECFFYALLPLLLWALLALRLDRPLGTVLLALGLWAGGLGYTWVFRNHPAQHWWCYINPLFRLVDFAIGVLLCLLFVRLGSLGRRLPGKKTATVLELASLAVLGAAFGASSYIPQAIRLGSYYTPFMAGVVLIFACQRGYLSDLLGTRVFQFLGEISFSFYMLHFLLLMSLNVFGPSVGLNRTDPVVPLGLALAACVGLSGLCYYAYETPMREWVKYWLSGQGRHRRRTKDPVADLAAGTTRAA
jgi:peptidoglycan/LPS O-acetylase OafA/YrhL